MKSNIEQMSRSRFSVHHEWGILREVIVGIGTGIIIPKWVDGLGFMSTEMKALCQNHGGELLQYCNPELATRMEQQPNELASMLQSLNVKVHRLLALSPAENDYLAADREGTLIYSRDALLLVGNNIIETSLRIPRRRKERYAFRHILRQLILDSAANWGAATIRAESGNFPL